MPSPRIVIVGAGGVGGPFGAALARGGHDVTFIARGPHLTAMRNDGLRIEGARGSFHMNPAPATDDPASLGIADYVIFTPKLWDVENTGEFIKPLVGPETAVIPIQNGIDAAERLAPILGVGTRDADPGARASAVAAMFAPRLEDDPAVIPRPGPEEPLTELRAAEPRAVPASAEEARP